jgi:catechol 2,3-dioxygenase-like lactoylglutathione lyase family enzyme
MNDVEEAVARSTTRRCPSWQVWRRQGEVDGQRCWRSTRAAPGSLHHVELWVPDLPRGIAQWGWLLGQLGYAPFQDWPHGRSWRLGHTSYLVIEQSPALTATRYDRLRPGMNHLAFHAGSRHHVDVLAAEGLAHEVRAADGGPGGRDRWWTPPPLPALNARASGLPPSERLAQGLPVPPLLAVIISPQNGAGGVERRSGRPFRDRKPVGYAGGWSLSSPACLVLNARTV